MERHKYTAEEVADTIIADIRKDPTLLACKSFAELHDHCDANCLGCQEALVDELGIYWALPILNDAQHEVSIWLVANSIKNLSQRCEIDMDVESHNEGFKLKYGRYPDWYVEEAFCDQFWFDPIFIKIRALVKQRTGK